MKTRIFNLIILDESGSMQLIKEEAINGVNETVQTILHAQQKHKEQEHFVSLVTFNIDTRTIWECIPATEIKEISRTDYYPNCSTALYDAMGMSLNALLPHVAPNDKILVTIVTDGEENASKEYICNLDYSKNLIEMDLKQETIGLLAVMYEKFWCPEEEKQDLINIVKVLKTQGIKQSEIAEILKITKGRVSQIVKEITKK